MAPLVKGAGMLFKALIVVVVLGIFTGYIVESKAVDTQIPDRPTIITCTRSKSEIRTDLSSSPDRTGDTDGAVTAGTKRLPSGRTSSAGGDGDDQGGDDVVDVSRNLIYRLRRFVRYAGIIQRLSVEADIPREDVVQSVASQFQDRSSHYDRGRNISETIKKDYPKYYNELWNFVGHTKIVPKYANVWHGLGGDIDRLQSDYFNHTLAKEEEDELNDKYRNAVDFSILYPSRKDSIILENFRNAFLEILHKRIETGGHSAQEICALQRAVEEIEDIGAHDLFLNGQDGYLSKHSEQYQRK